MTHYDASIRYETLADALIKIKNFADASLINGQVSCSADKSNLQTLSFMIEQIIDKAQNFSAHYASRRQ